MIESIASAAAKSVVWAMDPNDRIKLLQPEVQDYFRGLIFLLALAGYGRAKVCAGLRDLDYQRKLYGIGRTQDECRSAGVSELYADVGHDKVTWCLPEESAHVIGCAVDVDFAVYGTLDLLRIRRCACVCNMAWGGDWSERDYGHFEIRR